MITVNRWERGLQQPGTYFQVKLCALFGKSVEELGLVSTSPVIINAPSVLSEKKPALACAKHSNRQRMLTKVHTVWIKGGLELSLHNTTGASPCLQPAPDAVGSSWQHAASYFPHSLSAHAHITEVFDAMGGELLILGEPGSGKTTLLLELARDLLDRAQQDESHPIPTIFHLSSWAEEELPLAQWLMKELTDKYQVPQNLSQEWIDGDFVLPLLDGLDQVPLLLRPKCIATINSYRQQHGLLPVAICCRCTDYFSQANRLLLLGAVKVQPCVHRQ